MLRREEAVDGTDTALPSEHPTADAEEEARPRGSLLHRVGGATTVIIFAGLLVRVFVLAHGVEAIDRGYAVDDAYYTLTIARALAHSFVPSVDGIEVTTGFQPLLALLEMPAFLLGASNDAAAVAGFAAIAATDVVVAIALSKLARLAGGELAAIIAAGMWSLSPVAMGETFVGLEAPLATATTLVAALALERLREKPCARRGALLGATLGLCMLARVDTALFVTAALGVVAFRHRRSGWAVVATTGAVALPWVVVCLVVTGRPFPESGTAVLALVNEGKTLESLGRIAGFAAGFVAPGGLVDLPELRIALVDHPVAGAAALIAIVAALIAFARRAPLAVRTWLLGTTALLPFYVLLLPAIWAFHRYLLPVRVAATLVLAVTAAGVVKRLTPRLRTAVLGLAGATMAILLTLSTSTRLSGLTRGDIDGITGYREAALAMFAAAPTNATLASLQTGALGYFHPPGTSVVNLDGVVSRDAHRAFVAHRLDERLRARGVTHLADWKVGLIEIQNHSKPDAFFVEPLVWGPPQGRRRFLLARLVWPN